MSARKIILIVTKNRGGGYGGSDYCPIPFKAEVFEGKDWEIAERAFREALLKYIPDWKENLSDCFDLDRDSDEFLLEAAMQEGSSNDDYSVNLVWEGCKPDEDDGLYESPGQAHN